MKSLRRAHLKLQRFLHRFRLKSSHTIPKVLIQEVSLLRTFVPNPVTISQVATALIQSLPSARKHSKTRSSRLRSLRPSNGAHLLFIYTGENPNLTSKPVITTVIAVRLQKEPPVLHPQEQSLILPKEDAVFERITSPL